jgi:hypothetical protein
MENDTMLIHINSRKAIGFLRELETLQWIKVIENAPSSGVKLSDKYRGILTKDQGKSLQAHITQMRNEWDSI